MYCNHIGKTLPCHTRAALYCVIIVQAGPNKWRRLNGPLFITTQDQPPAAHPRKSTTLDWQLRYNALVNQSCRFKIGQTDLQLIIAWITTLIFSWKHFWCATELWLNSTTFKYDYVLYSRHPGYAMIGNEQIICTLKIMVPSKYIC